MKHVPNLDDFTKDFEHALTNSFPRKTVHAFTRSPAVREMFLDGLGSVVRRRLIGALSEILEVFLEKSPPVEADVGVNVQIALADGDVVHLRRSSHGFTSWRTEAGESVQNVFSSFTSSDALYFMPLVRKTLVALTQGAHRAVDPAMLVALKSASGDRVVFGVSPSSVMVGRDSALWLDSTEQLDMAALAQREDFVNFNWRLPAIVAGDEHVALFGNTLQFCVSGKRVPNVNQLISSLTTQPEQASATMSLREWRRLKSTTWPVVMIQGQNVVAEVDDALIIMRAACRGAATTLLSPSFFDSTAACAPDSHVTAIVREGSTFIPFNIILPGSARPQITGIWQMKQPDAASVKRLATLAAEAIKKRDHQALDASHTPVRDVDCREPMRSTHAAVGGSFEADVDADAFRKAVDWPLPGGSVWLTATDDRKLVVTSHTAIYCLQVVVPARVWGEGTASICGIQSAIEKGAWGAIKAFKGATRITLDDKLVLRNEGGSVLIEARPDLKMPVLDQPSGASITVQNSELAAALRTCLPYASNDIARPSIQQVALWVNTHGNLAAAATDGTRMMLFGTEDPSIFSATPAFCVPVDIADVLLHALDTCLTSTWAETESGLVFRAGNFTGRCYNNGSRFPNIAPLAIGAIDALADNVPKDVVKAIKQAKTHDKKSDYAIIVSRGNNKLRFGLVRRAIDASTPEGLHLPALIADVSIHDTHKAVWHEEVNMQYAHDGFSRAGDNVKVGHGKSMLFISSRIASREATLVVMCLSDKMPSSVSTLNDSELDSEVADETSDAKRSSKGSLRYWMRIQLVRKYLNPRRVTEGATLINDVGRLESDAAKFLTDHGVVSSESNVQSFVNDVRTALAYKLRMQW